MEKIVILSDRRPTEQLDLRKKKLGKRNSLIILSKDALRFTEIYLDDLFLTTNIYYHRDIDNENLNIEMSPSEYQDFIKFAKKRKWGIYKIDDGGNIVSNRQLVDQIKENSKKISNLISDAIKLIESKPSIDITKYRGRIENRVIYNPCIDIVAFKHKKVIYNFDIFERKLSETEYLTPATYYHTNYFNHRCDNSLMVQLSAKEKSILYKTFDEVQTIQKNSKECFKEIVQDIIRMYQ